MPGGGIFVTRVYILGFLVVVLERPANVRYDGHGLAMGSPKEYALMLSPLLRE